mmetsp:Transcript_12932/g.36443  ORF Transcript_12932/g.36443 Transcript_12932/m.36443 type:complete len:992 (+) Transcript_12932:332-3307(+)|eukprot:CAMPEP_0172369572 /NCGR_PEP_ID=MMETSP1060-20121228/33312_1 /TAXON_ID=37318 /ORGANISM="Pseudo-nitzschia pungens, Strain cf. cingulata" /LENGTH=991 /DNA_ID=CAMNT_0013094525 /DNA_START=319 /DNA_END=3294 /DNA_ORIENTATION=+
MAGQNEQRRESSSNISFRDKITALGNRPSRNVMRSTQPYNSRSIHKNPLNPIKDGEDRLSMFHSSTTTYAGYNSNNELEDDTTEPSASKRLGFGGVSYFPDQVARVSYLASIVKPDVNGEYLQDLQDGMDVLATRLAPSFFPGAIVRAVTTQVDGYFPAVCPSERFTNCQDVTASIGIYLNAIPITVNETETGSYNSYNSHTGAQGGKVVVDPSAMTEELIAFQESFEAAIANNELQEAIEHEYWKKQDGDSNPPVVIVTETIGNVDAVVDIGNDAPGVTDGSEVDGFDTGEGGTNDEFPFVAENSGDISTDTTDESNNVALDAPISTVIMGDGAEDGKKVGVATGGVIGTVLISLLLVSLLALSRRRRRGDNESGGASFVNAMKKTKKNHGRGHSRATIVEGTGDHSESFDQSGQILLQNVYLAEGDSEEYVVDVEEGNTGRTMRTTETASTNATGSSHDRRIQEMFVPVIPSYTNNYNLGDNRDSETSVSASDDSNRTVYNKVMLPIAEYNLERATDADNVGTRGVIPNTSDGLTTLNNKGLLDSYDVKYDDDDDNEYVMCEDSDSSVGEHLLSVTRSSALGLLATKSSEITDDSSDQNPDPTMSPIPLTRSNVADAIPPHEAESNTPGAYDTNSSSHISLVPPLSVASSNESGRSIGAMKEAHPLQEMDLAIANGDWATVGATAALMAINSVPPNQQSSTRRKKRGSFSSSSSSVSLLDYNERANELDTLIQAGDWEGVAVTAAKYDAEGDVGENRSCLSRASTHGSETEGSNANDSAASQMDYSSVDRSLNTGKSMMTSASQRERLQEIRERVTEMVRDVVPDEVDNVDEMMMQFRGKEEELMETLRTMKERDVARKARLASQSLARRNTRSREKAEDFPSATDDESVHGAPDETITTIVERGELTEKTQDSYQNSYTISKNNASSSITTDETDENVEQSHTPNAGSFTNATTVDPDKAAADAAAWAIQRSLDELMEREEREAYLKK